MDIITLSFSQNTRVEKSNSFQIAEMIEEIAEQPVRHLNIRDYNIMPCHLCADCADSHVCEIDKAFRTLLSDIANPDMIFITVYDKLFLISKRIIYYVLKNFFSFHLRMVLCYIFSFFTITSYHINFILFE